MIETDETKRDYHGRFSRFWWPGIVDEHTARRAAAYGAVMALFQAFLMLLVAVLTIFHVAYFIDEPWWDLALSVALFVLLAWLIYWRLSRIAWASARESFTAIANALRCPTNTASFFARVIPV
jgi:hypothetical protein